MQLEVHLNVELCLQALGMDVGTPSSLASGAGKPPQPSSNAALKWCLGLGLVPGAWMEQEGVMMGLWPAALFEHRYSQTLESFTWQLNQGLDIPHGMGSTVELCINRSAGGRQSCKPQRAQQWAVNWCQ